jgi:hypothetical protein
MPRTRISFAFSLLPHYKVSREKLEDDDLDDLEIEIEVD